MKRDRSLTVGDVILRSAKWLEERGVDSPRLDAELLLARIFNCTRLQLYMDWHKPMTDFELSGYRESIRLRGTERMPIARISGKKEFYGREFEVTPAVFVPRPETEGLVDRALDALASEQALRIERPTVFEIGTGSGCIIVSLAAENASPRYHASDVSAEALEVARRNAHKNKVEARIEFHHGSLFAGFEGTIHMLVSNPPYIASGEIPTLPPEVSKHDPLAALDGGADGLDTVRGMTEGARALLAPRGVVWLELGEDQAKSAPEIFHSAKCFCDVRMEEDLSGRPRYLFARKAEK